MRVRVLCPLGISHSLPHLVFTATLSGIISVLHVRPRDSEKFNTFPKGYSKKWIQDH